MQEIKFKLEVLLANTLMSLMELSGHVFQEENQLKTPKLNGVVFSNTVE